MQNRPLAAKGARRARRSSVPDARARGKKARDVFVGPAAKRACSRPEFVNGVNVVTMKPLCSVSINMHYMPQQKSFLPPSTITRDISEASPPRDASQSGSSGKPEEVTMYVPVQEAADESPAIHIAVNASPVAGAQPPPQHALMPPVSSHLSAWSALPAASYWVINTIKRGYTLQFARRPPRFGGVIMTEVSEQSAPLLRAEISSLLAKQAVEIVPEERRNSGFYSRYFLVPKKDGGMRPILDLRLLNKALAKRTFKMITVKQILAHIQPDDYFIAVDLKDAYFHIQIAPHHRRFLRFAFEGVAYQFKVLPFGLALAPRVFTMCMNTALAPLKLSGMRILNYLDDWLVIARSRSALEEHKHRLLAHLTGLGLSVNIQKSTLQPRQSITFLGMILDSRTMIANLSEPRIQSIHNTLALFVQGRAIPLRTFQRLLGLMAAAASVCRLGLLHMRPLQHWLQGRVQPRAWRAGTERLIITRSCLETLAPWFGTTIFEQGAAMGRVVRRVVVTTDASLSGWGALCDGRPAFGTWAGDQTRWHINCLEMEAVHLALQSFLPFVKDRHVLIRTDNTAVVAYINRQGGLRSRSLQGLARQLLLWTDRVLLSIRAVHVPGSLNCGADMLSRDGIVHGEWRLHPQTINMIWNLFGKAEIDLFASQENTHCPLYFSLTASPLGGDALSSRWPKGRKYGFPPVKLMPLVLQKIREERCALILVAPKWPNQPWFPELVNMSRLPPWRIPPRRDLLSQARGTIWHPNPELWDLHVWQISVEYISECCRQ